MSYILLFTTLVLSNTFEDYLKDVKINSKTCDCACEDARDGTCRFHADYCYTPVCTQGHYLCCGTCSMSSCQFRLDFEPSTRGLRECILCPAGHYCPGCDLPVKCPPNTYNTKLAQNKAENCLACPRDYEANEARTACCTVVGSAAYYALGQKVVCSQDPVEVDPAVVIESAGSQASLFPAVLGFFLLASVA